MKSLVDAHGHIRTCGFLLLGFVLLACSTVLLTKHVRVIQGVQQVSVPLVARLGELEHREEALRSQLEISQLHSAVQVGSLGEKLDVYILPKESQLDRLVALFDILYEVLQRQGIASEMSEIEIGDPFSFEENGVRALPITVRFTAHKDGIDQILILTRVAGLLTVGDALTEDEVALLFRSTEEENPAGIVALEQFLSLDLLRYVRDIRAHEDQLLRSFVSPAFESALQNVTQASLLRDARRILEGDFGRALDEKRIWPLQFLVVQEARLETGNAPEWYTLTLNLHALERL